MLFFFIVCVALCLLYSCVFCDRKANEGAWLTALDRPKQAELLRRAIRKAEEEERQSARVVKPMTPVARSWERHLQERKAEQAKHAAEAVAARMREAEEMCPSALRTCRVHHRTAATLGGVAGGARHHIHGTEALALLHARPHSQSSGIAEAKRSACRSASVTLIQPACSSPLRQNEQHRACKRIRR